MLTRKQVEELPDGTILFLPKLKENVILGHYDFDEFYASEVLKMIQKYQLKQA